MTTTPNQAPNQAPRHPYAVVLATVACALTLMVMLVDVAATSLQTRALSRNAEADRARIAAQAVLAWAAGTGISWDNAQLRNGVSIDKAGAHGCSTDTEATCVAVTAVRGTPSAAGQKTLRIAVTNPCPPQQCAAHRVPDVVTLSVTVADGRAPRIGQLRRTS